LMGAGKFCEAHETIFAMDGVFIAGQNHPCHKIPLFLADSPSWKANCGLTVKYPHCLHRRKHLTLNKPLLEINLNEAESFLSEVVITTLCQKCPNPESEFSKFLILEFHRSHSISLLKVDFLVLNEKEYRPRGAIFLQNGHFSVRFLLNDKLYFYDGMKNNAHCIQDLMDQRVIPNNQSLYVVLLILQRLP